MKNRICLCALLALFVFLSACVNQHPEEERTEDFRIITTSAAVTDITDRLGLDLIGIPHSDLKDTPARYKDVPEIGMPMSPDIELLKSMKPDLILSPSSLEADLKPKYEASDIPCYFLDLKSVKSMYESIGELGEMLDKKAEAQALRDEFTRFYEEYKTKNTGQESPRVLILLGLPGSYIVATENAYIGDLVKLAGGVNVYEEETEEFIAANTEDMAGRDPDIILRAAHALPDKVTEMFAKEFNENDIWKHFRAVREGRVYDLPYEQFGMSATFAYPEALGILDGMLYGSRE
ncbi:putative ABC transporter (periplasmic binding protein) [Clostridia bacterium]|nr:putative ABC transporter (periplasmic binding protein) [Clostridia bacterium]